MIYDEKLILDTINNTVIRHMNDQPHLFGKPKKQIHINDLRAKPRHREMVITRNLCMYLCNFIFNDVLKAKLHDQQIADFYDKDRCTVIYAKKVIRDLQDSDRQILDMTAYCMDVVMRSIKQYQPSQDEHRWYGYLYPQTTIL